MEAKQAATLIHLLLVRVPEERRWDVLSWVSQGFDRDGKPIDRTPENRDLINHLDCPHFDECRADVDTRQCQRR